MGKLEEMKQNRETSPWDKDLGCCYKIYGIMLIRTNDLLVLKNSITFEGF